MIRIYAEAFGQDPEFYQFLRTLEAYEQVINSGTTLILPSDSELLKYLNPSERIVQPPQTNTNTNAPAYSTPLVGGNQ